MDQREGVWRERAVRDAVLAGDRAAWRAWYDEHFPRLAAYVGWRCGGLVDLADDAIQDTWLTAVRRLRAFDPARGSFAAWLRGIAANAVRNALRSRRRFLRRTRPLEATSEPIAPADPAAVENAERVAAALGRSGAPILVEPHQAARAETPRQSSSPMTTHATRPWSRWSTTRSVP